MLECSDRPSQHEIDAVIKFLNTGPVGACKIHKTLCAAYWEDNSLVVRNVYRSIEIILIQ